MKDPTLDAAHWFACEEPERPTDAWVMWHYHECVACQMKAEMMAVLYPDDTHIGWLNRVMQGGVS